MGAFLNLGVDFNIYMEAFEGLYKYSLSSEKAVRLLKRHGWDPSKDQVILLKKSLYGLKQAPYLWQQKVTSLVRSLGYQPLVSDSTTYYSSKDRIFIISHIDDCLLVGPFIKKINALKKSLSKAYNIEDLSSVKYFLGVQV